MPCCFYSCFVDVHGEALCESQKRDAPVGAELGASCDFDSLPGLQGDIVVLNFLYSTIPEYTSSLSGNEWNRLCNSGL